MTTTPPIVLDESYLTEIQGEPCSSPCRVRVALLAGTNFGCVVESECFPRSILQRHHEEPFQISLASGPKFQVRLGSYNPNTINRVHFTGKLIPVRSPFLVADNSTQLNVVNFDILNFTSFFSQMNLTAYDKSTRGRTWEMDISSAMSIEERKQYRQMGGYVITHEGTIQFSKKAVFSVGEVWCILQGLSRYLSFSQGARCAVVRVRGTRESGEEIPIVWGSTHVHNSGECQGVLYTSNSGYEPLSSAWPGFLDTMGDENVTETILRAVDWYLLANNSDFGTGLVLGQAALELLASTGKGGNAADKIGEAIESANIYRAIPLQCKNLVKVANAYSWESGPIAITRIRNDLVHAERKYPDVNPEAQLEARELALWYIELLLLNRFQYTERYKVRSAIATDTAYASVPWVKDHQNQS